MEPFMEGELVLWQARNGRVRVPPLIPCRVVRMARTRVVVQPLDWDDRTKDSEHWKPQHVQPQTLRRLATTSKEQST